MKNNILEPTIAIIDLKAFYSSVECIDRGLNPFLAPLVVTDTMRGKGTIILSVTPYLKKRGIPSRLRLYELPPGEYIYAPPRMERYLQINAEIIALILEYIGEDDIHIYSIDELFIDTKPYLSLYKTTPLALISKIIKKIEKKFHLTACAGLGPNMFLAKCALDLEAKQSASGIAIWTFDDIGTKLHPVTPLRKIWGISERYQKRLNDLGLFTVGDLANCPVELLRKKFGILGEQLHQHANGIDESKIRQKYIPEETSLTNEQVLTRNYQLKEIPILLREMCDEISLRLRLQKQFCRTIHLSIHYPKEIAKRGVSIQRSLIYGTDDSQILYEAFLEIFQKYTLDLPIRKISITLSNLYCPHTEQLNLFNSQENNLAQRNLQNTIDAIRNKFGKNAILRGDALTNSSTIIERHNLIGGHKK